MVNDNLMELLIMINACKIASAERVSPNRWHLGFPRGHLENSSEAVTEGHFNLLLRFFQTKFEL